MSASAVFLRELETQHLTLAPADGRHLRRHHDAHLELRPLPGDPDGWLVTPRQVCGVIPLPSGRVLHIEPKVPIGNLWQMLAQAWDAVELGLPTPARGVAGLLDGLMAAYVRELDALLGRGLARGFVTRRAVLPAIRGRLDVAAQLRLRTAACDRFACVYHELHADTPANRVLRAALEVARVNCARHLALGAALHRCLRALGGVSATPIGRCELASVCAPAAARHYRPALALARLILEGCAVSHRPGGRQVPALIVDTARLFERFVGAVLARGLPADLRARTSGRGAALDEERRALLTPDVVVEAGGTPACVVDAKYKTSAAASAEPGSEDLYQMLAYCVGYRVPAAVLVYPEPRATAPLVIARGAWRAHIHVLGIDLAGDWAQVRAQGAELCRRVAEIAGQ